MKARRQIAARAVTGQPERRLGFCSHSPMQRFSRNRAFVWLLAIGCSSSPKPSTAPAPEHALSGMAAQHVIVTPAYAFVVAPEVGWSVSRPSDVLRTLDADIASAL